MPSPGVRDCTDTQSSHRGGSAGIAPSSLKQNKMGFNQYFNYLRYLVINRIEQYCFDGVLKVLYHITKFGYTLTRPTVLHLTWSFTFQVSMIESQQVFGSIQSVLPGISHLISKDHFSAMMYVVR